MTLSHLNVKDTDFAELPAGFTALSRLTELMLGRANHSADPLQLREKRPLSVVALGDLSGFPTLCKLTFEFCEVKLCMSLLGGAVRHRSLVSIFFNHAHPAPECAPMVMQLSQELRRSSVLKLARLGGKNSYYDRIAQSAPALPPFYKFKAALELCAL